MGLGRLVLFAQDNHGADNIVVIYVLIQEGVLAMDFVVDVDCDLF